ncbi:MAG: hypothetical protein K6B42_00290 [Clostridia bacterium]|nr:hypothetical protein [Clostridia bacterium]
MINTKKLTKVIEQSIIDSQQKKQQLQKRIQVAKTNISTAQREIEVATASDSEADYIRASDKLRFNESVIKVNEAELKALENVSPETVKSLIDKVTEAQKEIALDAESNASDAVAEIISIAQKAHTEIDALQKAINDYAEETGNVGMIQPYRYDSVLDGVVNDLRARKNRTDQNGRSTALFSKVK